MTQAPTASRGPVATWWQRTGGGLPRAFWFLWAGQLVNRLGYFVEPFLALYLVRGRDLSVATAGVLVAMFGVGAFASQPVGGWLADRVGRRFTLAAGMVATAAALLGLGAARGVVLLGILAALAGLAIDLYRPAVAALVADIISPGDRARAFALLYWAINLGVSVAAVLGGALAERGYWLLFVVDAVTCLAFAGLILRGVPETRPERVRGEPSGYAAVLRDRLLVALTAVTLVGATVYLQCFVTLPLAVTGDGLGPSAYGIVYAVNPAAVILIQPLTLRWLTGLPLVVVYAGSVVLIGAGFGLTAFAHTIPAYVATVLVWTLGEIAFNAVGPTLVADIAPPALRGRYSGMIGVAFGAAAFLAPLVGTAVLQHLGGGVLWSGCFLVSAVSAGAVVALGPAIERRRSVALRPP